MKLKQSFSNLARDLVNIKMAKFHHVIKSIPRKLNSSAAKYKMLQGSLGYIKVNKMLRI